MFNVPFFSDLSDDESWRNLKVGDKAKVRRDCPIRPGQIGVLKDIKDGTYLVRFDDGQEVGFDGDMLKEVR